MSRCDVPWNDEAYDDGLDPKYLLDKNLRWELRVPWWKRLYLRIFRRYTG